jgi:hypothetical protein
LSVERTERAQRFLEALAEVISAMPPWLTWGVVALQILAGLIWFGVLRPKRLLRLPGIPLGTIYLITPFYILILASALHKALWPEGPDEMTGNTHLFYVLGALLLALIPLAFAIWLVSEKLPPLRLVPRWMRAEVAAKKEQEPPTDEHGIRRDGSSTRQRRKVR